MPKQIIVANKSRKQTIKVNFRYSVHNFAVNMKNPFFNKKKSQAEA